MAIDRMSQDARRWIAGMLVAAGLLALALATATPVPDTRAALVLRFGQPLRVIDGSQPGQAGLAWHLPLVDHIVWLDRRLLDVAVDNVQIPLRDGQALAVDAYATWRVTDPVRFYQAFGSPERADGQLRAMLAAALRAHLGQNDQAGALARGQGAEAVRAAFAQDLAGYGATVADLRLSRVVPADGAPLDTTYARMTAGAEAEAAAIAAEGHRAAQDIRADAQAHAGRIYAASFGKDPQFHDFYRAMQSYDATLAQKGGKTTIVLSPDNAWLRQFRGN